MSETVIREAKESDCKHILTFMQELAKDQQKTAAPKLTVQDLEKDGFRGSPVFTMYVSQTKEGQIVGYILFYYTYSTWEGRSACIEELFVTASYRRKGIGSALMKKVVQIALEKGCCRCNINTMPENKFLLSQGAVDLTNSEKWLYFRMYQEAMEAFVKNCKTLKDVKVRESTKSDCHGIRKLIQDLADYEEIPDGPKIDASVLESDGHGDRAYYKCYVAEANGVLIGYCLYFFTYNSDGLGVYMEDLYVSPELRGKGIGVALWGSAIKACLDLGGSRCDFAVLDWNTPSIDFYKKKGAIDLTQEKNHHFYRMVKGTMEKYAKE